MTDQTPRSLSRRRLLQVTAGTAAAAGLAAASRAGGHADPPRPSDASSMIGVPFEARAGPPRPDRLRRPGTEPPAEHARRRRGRGEGALRHRPREGGGAQAMVEKAGQARPEGYSKGETDFETLCARGDLDLVLVATPWNWHVRMAVAVMEGGAHAGVEVPAATTLEGCWRLVDTSERTRRHCVMLENVCYGWDELFVLNLVRAGGLGELTHAECAYIHDLRSLLFAAAGRGALASVRALAARRQHLPDPRPRAGGPLLRRQPGRPLRVHGLDELALGGAAGVPGPHPRGRGPAAHGDLRVRRHEHQPDQDRARVAASFSSTTSSRRAPTTGSTWSRARRAPSAATPRGSSSTGRRTTRSGRPSRRRTARRAGSRTATSTSCGSASARPRGAGATAGWTTSCAGGSSSASGRGSRRTWTSTTPRPGAPRGPLSELSVAQRSTSVPFPDFTRGGWDKGRA